ncbi:hypothetical protein Droror1_Dr00013450 [Drosera rotundifolia]
MAPNRKLDCLCRRQQPVYVLCVKEAIQEELRCQNLSQISSWVCIHRWDIRWISSPYNLLLKRSSHFLVTMCTSALPMSYWSEAAFPVFQGEITGQPVAAFDLVSLTSAACRSLLHSCFNLCREARQL